jgi:hypothetical protein
MTMLQPTRRPLSSSISPEKSITEMDEPPYSLDLTPSDFWLFPKIKSTLKGRGFQDVEDIHKNVRTAMKAFHNRIPKMFPTVATSLGSLHGC